MILVIGDIMIDQYVWGNVSRISPEAPIPVLNKTRKEWRMGGAANVAANLLSVGVDSLLCGVIGDDELGIYIQNSNIKGIYPIDKTRSTTIKTRYLDEGHNYQLLRVDKENTHPISPILSEELYKKILEYKDRIEAIIVSDYGKGLITKDLIDRLKVLSSTNNIKIIVDPYPGNFGLYEQIDYIKPNLSEAERITGIKANTEQDITGIGDKLLKDFNCKGAIVTRGKKGFSYFSKDLSFSRESEALEVIDVSGAGDTFTTFFTFGLIKSFSIEKSLNLANKASAKVVSKIGTSTLTKKELMSIMESL